MASTDCSHGIVIFEDWLRGCFQPPQSIPGSCIRRYYKGFLIYTLFFMTRWSLIRFASLLSFVVGLQAMPALAEQDGNQLRRGSYATFISEVEIRSSTGEVLRKATEGEVVRIRKIDGVSAEVSSGRPELAGGVVPLSALNHSTSDAHTAWVSQGARDAGLVDQHLAVFSSIPSSKEEPALEAMEALPAVTFPQLQSVKSVDIDKVIIGWMCPRSQPEVTGLVGSPDGSIFLTGKIRLPLQIAGFRAWGGGGRVEASNSEASDLPFIARFETDMKALATFVVFQAGEVASFDHPVVGPDGGIWVVAKNVSESLGGVDAPKATSCLLGFDKDLQTVTRSIPITVGVQKLSVDERGRPIILTGSPGRSGGGFLTRYYSKGHYERNWSEAPDGVVRRLKLDFSSQSLSNGPFAIWSKQGMVYPSMPTPIAPWGSLENAGESIVWTNVKSGSNPIRGADLKPEALAVENNGSIVVSGTIPFDMGFPDFDPFLMRFSPEGKLLWTNCFLTGLLSEPDQKTQALAIDPSNGDILVCYWQHGNNVQTLLLDPEGWLNKFTGTNGNIKISWIGRVEAESGKLKDSTYIYSQMPESKNPRWPDLNSATVEAMSVAGNGRVYVAGATTISFPTTSNAWLPIVSEYGGHPMFAVLKPDLSAPHYSTYLSAGKGAVERLAILPGGAAILVGRHSTQGTPLPVTNVEGIPFLSATPPEGQEEGVFLAILPVPEEDAAWSFNN
jgi:hypothetical protein